MPWSDGSTRIADPLLICPRSHHLFLPRAGLDARGFLFGPIIALRIGAAFVPVRKRGKLPGDCISVTYMKEYGPVRGHETCACWGYGTADFLWIVRFDLLHTFQQYESRTRGQSIRYCGKAVHRIWRAITETLERTRIEMVGSQILKSHIVAQAQSGQSK